MSVCECVNACVWLGRLNVCLRMSPTRMHGQCVYLVLFSKSQCNYQISVRIVNCKLTLFVFFFFSNELYTFSLNLNC